MSLNIGASTVIEYVVTNAISGPVNDAAVTVTILDNKGVEIPDEIWPFTCLMLPLVMVFIQIRLIRLQVCRLANIIPL